MQQQIEASSGFYPDGSCTMSKLLSYMQRMARPSLNVISLSPKMQSGKDCPRLVHGRYTKINKLKIRSVRCIFVAKPRSDAVPEIALAFAC
jgi:hypothetical protein